MAVADPQGAVDGPAAVGGRSDVGLGERRHDRVGGRVDRRVGVGGADDHASVGGLRLGLLGADVDGRQHLTRRRVDARDRRAVGRAGPHRSEPGGDLVNAGDRHVQGGVGGASRVAALGAGDGEERAEWSRSELEVIDRRDGRVDVAGGRCRLGVEEELVLLAHRAGMSLGGGTGGSGSGVVQSGQPRALLAEEVHAGDDAGGRDVGGRRVVLGDVCRADRGGVLAPAVVDRRADVALAVAWTPCASSWSARGRRRRRRRGMCSTGPGTTALVVLVVVGCRCRCGVVVAACRGCDGSECMHAAVASRCLLVVVTVAPRSPVADRRAWRRPVSTDAPSAVWIRYPCG